MSVLFKLNGMWHKAATNTVYSAMSIGTMLAYGGTDTSSAPSGFMFCHGQALSRTAYSDLFDVIGTNFGVGDGSTTFNLPDMRESVPVGAGQNQTNTIAAHDVYTVGQFKDDQMQSHTHRFEFGGIRYNQTPGYMVPDTYTHEGIQSTSNPSGRTGTTTHGKRTGVEYIIKVV